MGADPAHVPGRLDPEAAGAYVGELFERYGRLVFGVCRLHLRDSDEAEDATQQTFLSAYRSLLTGHEPREPAAWLGTIARNECRIRIRARMEKPLYAVPDVPAEAGPELEAARHEEIAALTQALAGLPLRQREAIVLREFYGLSHDEVGLALGVSTSAVDALLVRARKRLQKELRPARVSAAALALPLAVRDMLGQAIPGFVTGGSSAGITSKLASLPLLAKLAGATATVAVVGVAGGDAVRDHASFLPPPPASAANLDPAGSGPDATPVGGQGANGAAAEDESRGSFEDERGSDDGDGDEREDQEREDDEDEAGEAEAEGSEDEGEDVGETQESNEASHDDDAAASEGSESSVGSEGTGPEGSGGSDESDSSEDPDDD